MVSALALHKRSWKSFSEQRAEVSCPVWGSSESSEQIQHHLVPLKSADEMLLSTSDGALLLSPGHSATSSDTGVLGPAGSSKPSLRSHPYLLNPSQFSRFSVTQIKLIKPHSKSHVDDLEMNKSNANSSGSWEQLTQPCGAGHLQFVVVLP